MFTELWEYQHKKRQLEKFYKKQNDLVNLCKSDLDLLKEESDAEAIKAGEDAKQREKVWDTRLSLIAIVLNILMIAAKLVCAYLSHSLAVVASVVDSAMDIASGVVIWYTCRKIENTNRREYPVGMERLEPLTVLIVGMIMIFANVLVVGEALIQVITGSMDPIFDIPTIVVLCTGTAIKFVLLLICRTRTSAACQCLAIDQRNDCLTNMVALAGAAIGAKLWPYADPILGGVISGFIILTWYTTLRSQIPLLTGKTANPEHIKRITNIAIDHDPRIRCIDTVHVYHFGANHLVELHIVMEKDVCLVDAHDVAESLQKKIERLSFVQRAFVHTDYQVDGNEHIS